MFNYEEIPESDIKACGSLKLFKVHIKQLRIYRIDL